MLDENGEKALSNTSSQNHYWCLVGLRSGDCGDHSIWFTSFLISIKPSNGSILIHHVSALRLFSVQFVCLNHIWRHQLYCNGRLGVTCWFKAFLVLWYVVQWYVTHYTLWNIISLFNSASHCFGDLWGLLENLVINPNSRLFVWNMTSFPEFNWGQFLVIYFYRNYFLVVSSWQQTVVRLCFISMCVFCFYGF